jgi:hypothetical protein
VPATTIAKVLHAHDQAATSGAPVPAAWALRPGDVVLVDEAGMAGTPGAWAASSPSRSSPVPS